MEISFNQAFEQARKFEASLVYVEESGEVVTNPLRLSFPFPFPCQNMLYGPECDEYIRIFEYSNILVTNIYSDIHLYQFFFYEYIRIFVRV